MKRTETLKTSAAPELVECLRLIARVRNTDLARVVHEACQLYAWGNSDPRMSPREGPAMGAMVAQRQRGTGPVLVQPLPATERSFGRS